jgi:pimeloyl-ACP methyl ester carboxylesterase
MHFEPAGLEHASSPKCERPSGLLFLHGLAGKPTDWEPSVEHFSRHWRALAPEFPFFDLQDDQANITGLAEYVSDVLDRNNLETAILIGHSVGGHAALALALKHPERVSALALAGSSGLYELGPNEFVPRQPSREYLYDRVRELFYDERYATERLVEELRQKLYHPIQKMRLLRLAISAKRSNLRESLAKIQCPVLLVWGTHDVIAPPDMAKEFGQRLPDAELHFIEHCGHALPIERPTEFNHLLEGFLQHRFGIAPR